VAVAPRSIRGGFTVAKAYKRSGRNNRHSGVDGGVLQTMKDKGWFPWSSCPRTGSLQKLAIPGVLNELADSRKYHI